MHDRTRLSWLSVAVGLFFVSAVGLAIAQVTVTPYTATEYPIAPPEPGTVTHPDGNTHIRGATALYTRSGSDSRVSGGTLRVVVNYNLDKSSSGPIWGTGHWETAGGVWDGTFEGNINLSTIVGYYDAVWQGSGEFRNLQLRETCVYTGTPVGSCTGRILETPGK